MTICDTSSRWSSAVQEVLDGPGMPMIHRHTCRRIQEVRNTHTLKIKFKVHTYTYTHICTCIHIHKETDRDRERERDFGGGG